ISSSRHQVWPVAGFKEVTALGVHTINCLFPPALITMGELKACGGSLSPRQTSFPVCLAKATTHAPGLPQITTISRLPSINGQEVSPNHSPDSEAFPRSTFACAYPAPAAGPSLRD